MRFNILVSYVMQANILNLEEFLREVTIKIGLEKIDTQKEIIVEVLLDSSITELVMSLEFVGR